MRRRKLCKTNDFGGINMRVVSQDGIVDLPYEQAIIGLSARFGNKVLATDLANRCNFYVAEYSSNVKAKKAMEELRECYLTVMKTGSGSVDYPKIFQFPQDNEIE
jgi:hypothetical protein